MSTSSLGRVTRVFAALAQSQRPGTLLGRVAAELARLLDQPLALVALSAPSYYVLAGATGVTPGRRLQLRHTPLDPARLPGLAAAVGRAIPMRLDTAELPHRWRETLGPLALLVPIWSRDRRGGLFLLPSLGAEREERLLIAEALGYQTGIALENAELLRRVSQKEQALRSMVRSQMEAQEEERQRVAGDIHDGLTQQLVGIWYRVHACERLIETAPQAAREELAVIKARIDESLVEARNALYNLRPSTLDDLGLLPALHSLVARFQEETGVHGRIVAEALPDLPEHYEIALYRIVQEALNNARKHAQAHNLSVLMRTRGDRLAVEIRDDGRGFDSRAMRRYRNAAAHFGVAGMKERAKLLGGTLAVRSAPGHGTSIRVIIPLPLEVRALA
ncbi:MAG TPA: sensor histidine kinase [Candidatus Dormibacteraeota bacterium]|nr:sensor histidine kinase [Candidatus Dormibacteraeota bacterium]